MDTNRINTVKCRVEKFLSKYSLGFVNIPPVDQNNAVGSGSLLVDIENKVCSLKKTIENFKGPHYDAKFHQIVELGTMYQIELDKIKVEGQENVAVKKKKLLVEINRLIEVLYSKTHPDRMKCHECQ